MKLTVIYATYSNSTALAAEYLAQQLRVHGHQVELIRAAETEEATFADADGIIFASPSWDYNGQQGMPHEDFTILQQRLPKLPVRGKKLAVMGLGDTSFTYFCGAVDHLHTWLQDSGGELTTEALKIDGYYADEVKAQQQIAAWAEKIQTAFAAG